MPTNPERRIVRFDVAGIAQPKGSTRAYMPPGARFPVVTSDNPRARAWQDAIGWTARTVLDGVPFTGAVAIAVTFSLPRPRSLPRAIVHPTKKPDVDKLARCTLDALTGIAYADDSQVIDLDVHKRYTPTGSAPRASITITQAADPELAPLELFP